MAAPFSSANIGGGLFEDDIETTLFWPANFGTGLFEDDVFSTFQGCSSPT